MPASEPMGEDRRLALLNRLIETLGEEEARTLMESLPPMLWNHLATKDDLHNFRVEVNGRFAALTSEFNGEFARVHARMDGLESKVEAGFETLRAENANNRAEATLQFAKQTRTMVVTLIGFALTIWVSLLLVGIT